MADIESNTKALNIVPWGLHPLPAWLRTEIDKRANEYGLDPSNETYAGNRTAWIRFTSNGKPKIENQQKFSGFILGGVHGFNDSYGFNADGTTILGYDVNGEPHKISNSNNSYPNRPGPSIESVEVSLLGAQNSSFGAQCRKAKINWKCYSLDQLEYLSNYFLKPKITAVIEWGWNNFNQSSLVDLKDEKVLVDCFLNGGAISRGVELSKGKYDGMMGFIFDFGYTMNAQGGYDCVTEIMTPNWLLEGQEYKSTVKKDKDGKPQKGFIEFIETDLNSLSADSKRRQVAEKLYGPLKDRVFYADPKDSTHPNSIGRSDRKTWIRMDLVQEIMNKHFSLIFEDVGGKALGNGLVFDIRGIAICGHPGIKSVDADILIPNKFAPRFTTIKSEIHTGNKSTTEIQKSISSQITSGSAYEEVFNKTGISSTIENKGLTTEYDDLKFIINNGTTGNSFPVYEKGTGSLSECMPGTWGYLQDIFVSTKMIQEIVGKNDNAYRMLQELMDRISQGLCSIVQLKVVSHPVGATYSVIDTNFNQHSSAKTLPNTIVKFTPGAINSAFMTNATFTSRMSNEMAMQMIAQGMDKEKSDDGSDNNKSINPGIYVGTSNTSLFVGTDRLFHAAKAPPTEKSDSSPSNPNAFNRRDFSPSSDDWMFYQKGSKKYILVDTDREFIQGILLNDKNGKIIYLNSPIMPGTKFTMDMLGISGFSFLAQFTLGGVPFPYNYKSCIWQVSEIKHGIKAGTWTTNIGAECRPMSTI